MARMSERVRRLVGLENLLLKAKRRQRECERELGDKGGSRVSRYALVVSRIDEEIHSVDKHHLMDYLQYVEETLLERIARRVDATKGEMLAAATQLVDGKHQLHELRVEYTDALERIRTLRERLGRDPFKPLDVHFGAGVHPPNADRRTRDANILMREFLKS